MRLDSIQIFPIKSLDALSLAEARLTAGGILEHDREWAMFDEGGRVVNGKRTPRVHELRCRFGADFQEVSFRPNGAAAWTAFALDDPARLGDWLSEFFGFRVTLRREAEKGFPDDHTAFGPTIISTASLEMIRTWFPELELEGLRRRFRANLELGGCPAFAEDRLFGAPDELKPFAVGPVRFLGHNPCQRCVVPTRDAQSGQPFPDFQKKFMERRKAHLPAWADARRFNHYYRFAVNTSVPPGEAGKIIRCGDWVTI